ncbi:hypothetical protein HG531_003477 [Fusarium graminearum]|nr:hypothetical protein HG531_003477 [Fusarium graminearum]
MFVPVSLRQFLEDSIRVGFRVEEWLDDAEDHIRDLLAADFAELLECVQLENGIDDACLAIEDVLAASSWLTCKFVSTRILLNFNKAVGSISLCTHPGARNPNSVDNVVNDDASDQAGFSAGFLEMVVKVGNGLILSKRMVGCNENRPQTSVGEFLAFIGARRLAIARVRPFIAVKLARHGTLLNSVLIRARLGDGVNGTSHRAKTRVLREPERSTRIDLLLDMLDCFPELLEKELLKFFHDLGDLSFGLLTLALLVCEIGAEGAQGMSLVVSLCLGKVGLDTHARDRLVSVLLIKSQVHERVNELTRLGADNLPDFLKLSDDLIGFLGRDTRHAAQRGLDFDKNLLRLARLFKSRLRKKETSQFLIRDVRSQRLNGGPQEGVQNRAAPARGVEKLMLNMVLDGLVSRLSLPEDHRDAT